MVRLALIGDDSCWDAYVRIAPRIANGRLVAVSHADSAGASNSARLPHQIEEIALENLFPEHAGAFDAVLIHAPLEKRASYCWQAAAAGKHALVETPISESVTEAETVIAECQAARIGLMVANLDRFLPSIETVKNSLDSGKLGQPGLLRIHRWYSSRTHNAVEEGLVRDIDLACWMFGKHPSDVFAMACTPRSDYPTKQGYLQLHLGFPDGGMALIDESTTLPAGDDYFSLSLIGSTGAAYADDHRDMQLLYSGGHPQSLRTSAGDRALLRLVQSFVSAFAGNAEALTSAHAIAAQRIAETAIRSFGQC